MNDFPINSSELTQRTANAARKFRDNIHSLGGTISPNQKWLGALAMYSVICERDHVIMTSANRINSGQGICGICSHGHNGTRSQSSKDKFYAAVKAQGGTVNPGQEWCGSNTKYEITCNVGHTYLRLARNVISGQGICPKCSLGIAASEFKFYAAVKAQGGTVNPGQEWIGAAAKYTVTCKAGHICSPKAATVNNGQGICDWCSHNRDAARDKFYAAVKAQGGTVNPGQEWISNKYNYTVTCKSGHTARPKANDVINGSGICGQCWVIHDTFYIVSRPDGNVKFGITSGNPKSRLSDHAYRGYTLVDFLMTNLPMGLAKDTEDMVRKNLIAKGYFPMKGREYYGPEARESILKLASEHLSLTTKSVRAQD